MKELVMLSLYLEETFKIRLFITLTLNHPIFPCSPSPSPSPSSPLLLPSPSFPPPSPLNSPLKFVISSAFQCSCVFPNIFIERAEVVLEN